MGQQAREAAGCSLSASAADTAQAEPRDFTTPPLRSAPGAGRPGQAGYSRLHSRLLQSCTPAARAAPVPCTCSAAPDILSLTACWRRQHARAVHVPAAVAGKPLSSGERPDALRGGCGPGQACSRVLLHAAAGLRAPVRARTPLAGAGGALPLRAGLVRRPCTLARVTTALHRAAQIALHCQVICTGTDSSALSVHVPRDSGRQELITHTHMCQPSTSGACRPRKQAESRVTPHAVGYMKSACSTAMLMQCWLAGTWPSC